MSTENYLDCLNKRGLTGPFTPTCLPAALDILSKRRSIPAWAYNYYSEAYQKQAAYGASRKYTKQVISTILSVFDRNFNDITFTYAGKVPKLNQVLNSAQQSGKAIIIVTSQLHTVGLKHDNHGLWYMVGTWVPTKEHLTPTELMRYLYTTPAKKREPNIWLISLP